MPGGPAAMAPVSGAPRPAASEPAVTLKGAALRYGSRRLWSGLDLTVAPGEFLAVLGGNGSGKTSLLRMILGLVAPDAGTVSVGDQTRERRAAPIGYIPQQRRLDPLTPLRARDVVRNGLDGHRWGVGRPGGVEWERIDAALEAVGAAALAEVPVGLLSGGEQQRVRVAQALVSDPELLLCDEPLLSLDLASQQVITALIDRQRAARGTAVVFVTHEINPVLPYVDRVLYLAEGAFRIGTVEQVMTSETLSALYDAPIEVLHVHGRIVVVGMPEGAGHVHHDADADDAAHEHHEVGP